MSSAALALPPAAPPARPRVLLVGTALASAATAMAFVGMIGYYASTRAAAVAEGLKAAVQGICRVRVDEVGFGEVGDRPVVDEREWN